MSIERLRLITLTLSVVACGQSSWALVVPGVVDIPTVITFSEVPALTSNPVISAGGNTVRFGSLFIGQTLGLLPNELLDTTPDSPLALDLAASTARTMLDLSSPSMPVLGSFSVNRAAFLSPLAIRFDLPVGGVAFDLGHLDQFGTVTIEAYGVDGTSLGSIQNPRSGSNRIVLVEDSGQSIIAGISIYNATGEMDWEGFAVDNVGFDPGPGNVIPEPASVIVWVVLSVVALTVGVRKRKGVTV